MDLTAENLGVRRGEDFIFMNISFKLSNGEALVLTGRNGSGKSTLLRTVAGLLRPEQGWIKIAGEGIEEDMRPSEACHYLGHRNAMKMELTVSENLSSGKISSVIFPVVRASQSMRRLRSSVSPALLICPSVISPPANNGVLPWRSF